MLGAIIGDIAGSTYEFGPPLAGDFSLFPPDANWTDDTLMTFAVYDGLAAAGGDPDKAPQALVDSILRLAKTVRLPKGGYGGMFRRWLVSGDHRPYGSFGNGSAMRVSAVGWLFPALDETERWAEITAAITHNHPEGIKGAQATAGAIFLARTGRTKAVIQRYLEERHGYDVSRSWDEVRAGTTNGVSCQETVPEAAIAFLTSVSFEDCLRRAIALGGDTDTRAAIAGSIAEGFYGIDDFVPSGDDCRREAQSRLTGPLPGLLAAFQAQTLAARLAAVFAPVTGFLDSRPATPWAGGEVTGQTADGRDIRRPHYPDYAPQMLELHRRFSAFAVGDPNYLDNAKALGWPGDDPAAVIAQADVQGVETLLTWHMRGERFSDGLWARALENGHVAALARRALALAGGDPAAEMLTFSGPPEK
jgi:ADP-ribosylglycohydrolase